jgi:hypothetical protein
MKKGILNCDIVLKPRFSVIHAVNKHQVYDINTIITTGMRDAAYIRGGRFFAMSSVNKPVIFIVLITAALGIGVALVIKL